MEDDIREEVLDNPLVVHKPDDASYQEKAESGGMQTTHIDEDSDAPTLERHRFKKVKKKKKWPYVVLALVLVCAAVLAVLLGNGTIHFGEKETTAKPKKSYTTQVENPFENTITVKGTYLFYEGEELEGIGDLEREIKYLDAGTKFIVQDEKADSNFLNFEVLALLSQYEFEYEVTYVVSSGLTSKYETITAATEAPAETQSADSSQEATSSP